MQAQVLAVQMSRQLLEEGGSVRDCNIAGAANEDVNTIKEGQLISGALSEGRQLLPRSTIFYLLQKQILLLESFFLSSRPQMRVDKA